VKLAEAYGWKGIRIEDESQLDAGIQAMIDHDGPVIVDCLVAKEANCFPMIPSGAAHTDMILYGDRSREPWTTKPRRWSKAGTMMKIKHEASERHVLTITVDNEAGILAKIAGLFTARGYNIDSLTVADITENHSVSRITIVTHGPPAVIDQIHAQLERLVPVHKVVDLTEMGPTSSASWR
jgi:acetolactate synthase regulatory subunit